MTKKNIVVLTLTFLAVAGFYFYLYRDSFHKPTIQIFHTFRPSRAAMFQRAPDTSESDLDNSLDFGMARDYRLTSLKVISLDDLKTNKYPHPLWELTSTSNSVPLRAFAYGKHIRGMHPPVKGETATPLTPNVPYRLELEAGRISGQHDFTITDGDHMGQ
jgi:hypothetical protein